MNASIRQAGLVLGGTAAILALGVGDASAQETWRVQTSMTAGESYYTNIEQHWLPKLEAMTGGRLTIELTPVGSVVPYNETMDAIALGVLGEVRWDWLPALLLGSLLGGYLGAHFAILKGNRWIKRAFEVVTILVGIKLMAG